MKKRIIAFALAVTFVFAISSTVSAAAQTIMAELTYRNIKISIDGTAVTPKDANGKAVEPFIKDGTTYLPVRAVADALGLGVEWDSKTSTVKLSNPDMAVTGNIIYENEYVTITLKSRPYKDAYSNLYYFDVTAYNKSNVPVILYLDNAEVNNFMVDIYGISLDINPGAKLNANLWFNGDTAEIYEASDIKNVAFCVRVSDADTWNTYSKSELLHLSF